MNKEIGSEKMTEDKEFQKLIQRINELAHKAKNEGLTDLEIIERKELRQKYLKRFREGFKSQVEMMRVFDKSGKEVTPEKVKKVQRKKGLRND
ncbi:hypothetical protein IV87_GL000480 [Pediococcus ethanolidurans]|uniref:UPF0291 protein IV87_GL000480 n=2 Tax=Pediococcus ethanolidurans TaxID=319653 RepID=A0A0R2JY29_9LACO|nr:hypothetical protein IV87_GL000480 [Pediococcus ethanolidurans]MCT4397825.1 DUF896 domain-containing protein [Pediococcus ethanolidurans]MDV7718898.1 DUF896 domain-containing protein [Pediococcus ethanolidurans]